MGEDDEDGGQRPQKKDIILTCILRKVAWGMEETDLQQLKAKGVNKL